MCHGYGQGAAFSGLAKIAFALHVERGRTDGMAVASGRKRPDAVGVLPNE